MRRAGPEWRRLTLDERTAKVEGVLPKSSRQWVSAYWVARELDIPSSTARQYLRLAAIAGRIEADPFIGFKHTGSGQRTFRRKVTR